MLQKLFITVIIPIIIVILDFPAELKSQDFVFVSVRAGL